MRCVGSVGGGATTAVRACAQAVACLCWLPAILLAVWVTEAGAQEGGSEEGATMERLFTCIDLEQESLRLRCYDSIVRPLADARADPSFSGEGTITAFSGKDDQDTEMLTFEEPWRVRWTLDGSMLSIELRGSDNGLIDIVGNQIGAGDGSSRKVLPPGTYRFAIRAIGAWQVAIEPE